MFRNRNRFFALALIAAIPSLCAVLGFFGGRYSVAAWPRSFVKQWNELQTLQGMLGQRPEWRVDDRVQAYSRPAEAKKNLGRIVWWVPLEPHPFLGTQPRTGGILDCRINSQHMRSGKEAAMPKPAGTIRIFLAGASTAFSLGAPSEAETIDRFMERALNESLNARGERVEVFNAANPCWTTTPERILIENRLARLAPDLVVSLSGFNDVFNGFAGVDVFEARTYDYSNFLTLFAFSYCLAKGAPFPPSGAAEPAKPPLPAEQVAENLLENLRQGAYRLLSAGSPYLFALQPFLPLSAKKKTPAEVRDLAQFEKEGLSQEYFVKAYRAIAGRLKAERVENLLAADLNGVFDSLGDETMFLDTCHFGDKGNRVIGQALAAKALEILRAREK